MTAWVSIHAPAWGATPCDRERAALRMGFNPRARVGRDQNSLTLAQSDLAVSIHAPAWGATYAAAGSFSTGESFNPRARVGRDRAT